MGRKRKDTNGPVPDDAFAKRTWMDDVALVVEDRKLYVAKTVLALASPVFSTMFQSAFAERDQEEIELTGKKYEDMVEFLLCLYPSTRRLVTMSNVAKIVPLASEYQTEPLINDCEKCILQKLNDTSTKTNKGAVTLCKFLELAMLYGLKDLEEKCMEELCEKTQKEVEAVEKTYPMRKEVKMKIIGKMNQKMEQQVKQKDKQIKELTDKLSEDVKFYENELKRRDEFYEKEGKKKVQGTIRFKKDYGYYNLNAVDEAYSECVQVRGIDWKLKVEPTAGTEPYLALSVIFQTRVPHLTCLADVKITIVNGNNKKSNKTFILKDKVFSSGQWIWTHDSWMKWRDFEETFKLTEDWYSRSSFHKGEANIEAFIMAHDVQMT